MHGGSGRGLLEYFLWGSVFLVAVPGIVLLLAFGPSLLPDQRPPRAGTPGPVGVLLSLAALRRFVYRVAERVEHLL